MRVGFVCEGRTDLKVLKVLVESVFGPFTATFLQPEYDAVQQAWTTHGNDDRVRLWCERTRDGLGLEAEIAIGGLDLLVLQLDADTCGKFGAADTTALCATMREDWLGLDASPDELVVVVPSQSLECWLAVAHGLLPAATESEDEPNAEEHLADAGLLERKPNRKGRLKVHKPSPVYEAMAPRLVAELGRIRGGLVELERFLSKLEHAHRRRSAG